ncbi:hypothetical protein FM996_20270 [Methylosinus sporium]|uniref:Transglycosylase SLT domain-containing protein n=1 Tax=Methylosinus sporium TaxID=428 RepID=A0A549SD57_METSR|nr:hypothetical protein [Methylosinus sporium]TRL24693.1 hypothetical protein FM996_20270 [Methylosinus sporium]
MSTFIFHPTYRGDMPRRNVTRLAVALLLAFAVPAFAGDPVPVTERGLPQTVHPRYAEKGAPQFSYPTGSTDVGSGGGNNPGGGNVDYTACSGCDPLQTMNAQSWGGQACDAATTVGVSCASLAATCVMESNCRNVQGTGTVSGAFQMTNATYTETINQAAADNPNAGIDTSLAGKSDPANEAWGAAQYEYNGATYLQENGIPDPTFTDVRGYYQFGPATSVTLADAKNSDNLEEIVRLSPQAMAANGITATTTVGDWRQSIANRVGPAAGQTVLN